MVGKRKSTSSDIDAFNMEEKPKMKWKEKRNILLVFAIVGFVITLATVILVFRLSNVHDANVCFTEECAESSLFLLDLIDTTKKPCDDFYSLACAHHVPRATMENSQREINMEMRHFITGPKDSMDSISMKLQKKFYKACGDVEAIENDNNESLKRIFDRLGGWPFLKTHWNSSTYNWEKMMHKCKDIGLNFDWFIGFERSEITKNLLLVKPAKVGRFDFLKMANVMKILGATITIEDIATKINEVVRFTDELDGLAESYKDTTSQEYVFPRFKTKFPTVDWSKLFAQGNLTNNSIIISKIDEYFPKLDLLLSRTPKHVQANYIFWKLTKSLQQFLSVDVRKEFEIFEHLGGVKQDMSRQELCYKITREVFPFVSEGEYVRRLIKEREVAQGIIQRIKVAIMDHIGSVDWIDSISKIKAKNVIKKLQIIAGGPEEMYNEGLFQRLLGLDKMDILYTKNPLDVLLGLNKRKCMYNIEPKHPLLENKIFYGLVTDILATNYTFSNNRHFLIVPAATLEGLLFSKKRSNFLNYGLLGTIIARKFARSIISYKTGNISHCVLEACEKDALLTKNSTFNCNSDIDEYFVDFLGSNLAYEAYTKLEDHQENRLPGIIYHSRQVFWISYAATMCNNFDNDNINKRRGSRQKSILRVLSSLRNSHYFAQDFNCNVGTEMNPEHKCIS